jgi:hypothetical protein
MESKKRSLVVVTGRPTKDRKQVAAHENEKIALELSDRECELIVKHTFTGDELTRRLRIVPPPGEPPVYRFTLDDLDELVGYVAAEGRHAKVEKLEKELRRLYDRIATIVKSYSEEDDRPMG